jgi:hypothetical protein
MRKIHVWKDLEKTQKISSISASCLKPFRNGDQLKSRYQKLLICSILHFYFARHKNRDAFQIIAAKLPVNDILQISEMWKELEQMKRMQPTGTFSDHLFRS